MRITAIFILLIMTAALAAGCVSQNDQVPDTPVPTIVEDSRVAYLAGNVNSTDLIGLDKGTWIFDMSFDGSGDYEVDVMNNDSYVELRHGTGTYAGRQAFGALEEGGYTVKVIADGPWTISVLKPEKTSDKLPLSYDGTGDNVTDMFYLPAGNATFDLVNDGESFFGVWLFDENGNYVFDKTGTYLMPLPFGHHTSYNGTVTVPINSSGYYLTNVMTGGGNWTVSIS